MKDFNTPVEQIYEVWKETMRKANKNSKLELNDKYRNKFNKEAVETGLTKFPIWALQKSAQESVQKTSWRRYKLKFNSWKKNALQQILKDERSDIEIYPDGTTWVTLGSPTDIGRKIVGSVQNYEEES